MMKQVLMNQTLPITGKLVCISGCFHRILLKNIFIFLLPAFLLSISSGCGQKTETGHSNTNLNLTSGDTLKSAPISGNTSSTTLNSPTTAENPKITGFPSVQEFRDLLGNDPQYAGFARLLNEDFLLKYINVREAYDFVFFVPSEKNQEVNYLKQYLSYESAPVDKNAFWLNHIAVCSKGMPFEGNPTIYNVMLKRDKQVISYEGGSANITSEKRLKDGTQIIFIDKPFKIPIRK